jgi:predicted esterase
LIDKLKKANANVLFCTEDVGHSSPSKETMEKYYNWLNEVLKGVE